MLLEEVLRKFIDEFVINDSNLNIGFVINDGKIVKGKPIKSADEIIVGIKLYAAVEYGMTLIPEDELVDAMIKYNLAFNDKENDMLLTTSVVNYRKLWKATNIETQHGGGNEEILKAIQNLPHVLSVNINNSMVEQTKEFVRMISDVYQKSNDEYKEKLHRENEDLKTCLYMDIANKVGVPLFELMEQMKPSSKQNSEGLYSLPDELRTMIENILLDVQQQNSKDNNQ